MIHDSTLAQSQPWGGKRGCLGFYTDRRVVEHYLQYNQHGNLHTKQQWNLLNNKYHEFCQRYGKMSEVEDTNGWGFAL